MIITCNVDNFYRIINISVVSFLLRPEALAAILYCVLFHLVFSYWHSISVPIIFNFTVSAVAREYSR